MAKLRTTIKGFTLVELMITLAIAAILAAIAAPSFQNIIRNNRTVTNANMLVSTLNLARNEAINRGVQVTVRRKGTTSKNWDSGWDVFTDINHNGSFNDNGDANLCQAGEDCLLKSYPALDNDYTLRTENFSDWMGYQPDGMSVSPGLANDTFRLCDDLADIATSRRIIVNKTGRVSTVIGGAASCP